MAEHIIHAELFCLIYLISLAVGIKYKYSTWLLHIVVIISITGIFLRYGLNSYPIIIFSYIIIYNKIKFSNYYSLQSAIIFLLNLAIKMFVVAVISSFLFILNLSPTKVDVFMPMVVRVITLFIIFYLVSLYKKKYSVIFYEKRKIISIICYSTAIFSSIILIYADYKKSSLTTVYSLLLLTIFFIVSLLILITLEKISHKKQIKILEQKAKEYRENYLLELEKHNDEIRKFRHDYRNILLSIKCYLDDDDFDKNELQNYIATLTTTSSVVLEKNKLVNLENIQLPFLKGVIAAKLQIAKELGINCNVSIDKNLPAFNIDDIEMVRLMTIFLDNAIEASKETTKKRINFSIRKNKANFVTIEISNTFIKTNMEINDMYVKGNSTKGTNRGLGLNIAKEILNKNNALLETEIYQNEFIQKITLGGR